MHYIIQIPSGTKTLKYKSPAELSLKIPIRVEFSNSQSPAEQNFELQTLSEDETFFPNRVKNSSYQSPTGTIQFPQSPQRVVLNQIIPQQGALKLDKLTRQQLRIIPQQIGIQPKLLKLSSSIAIPHRVFTTLQQNKLSPRRFILISQQIEDSQSPATVIKVLGIPQAGFLNNTCHYSYNRMSIIFQLQRT